MIRDHRTVIGSDPHAHRGCGYCWEFPNLVFDMVVSIFALFCTLLRSFAPFCAFLRSLADLRLRSFARICAFLCSFACFCVRPRLDDRVWELRILILRKKTCFVTAFADTPAKVGVGIVLNPRLHSFCRIPCDISGFDKRPGNQGFKKSAEIGHGSSAPLCWYQTKPQ